jgi:inorganic pyrophosphatase
MAMAATVSTVRFTTVSASLRRIRLPHTSRSSFSFRQQRRHIHFTSPSALLRTDFKTEVVGQPETLDYRVFFLDSTGKKVSPWHDVPLHLGDGVFNFIVEIPKESSAKMEVATDEAYTPIKQDTKKGKLRYYP